MAKCKYVRGCTRRRKNCQKGLKELLAGTTRTQTRPCDLRVGAGGGYRCPQGTYCGSNYFVESSGAGGSGSSSGWWPFSSSSSSHFGQLRARFRDGRVMASDTHVDTLGWGFLADYGSLGAAAISLLQCITLEGWSAHMYVASDAYGPTVTQVLGERVICQRLVFWARK